MSKVRQVMRFGVDTTAQFDFNRQIIDAVAPYVCAFKPNRAFYAANGDEGVKVLHRTIHYIRSEYRDVPVILDAKEADINSTNLGYVAEAFSFYNADAITVHPYLGQKALKPFLDQKNKGIIVLVRTSNEGAYEFQDMDVSGDMVPGGYMPLYKYVAYRVARHWNTNGNCAVVVGATYPAELAEVREVVGNLPILIPGIGAQQPNTPIEEQVRQTVEAGQDARGQGMIINASRSVIFASNGPTNFPLAAVLEAKRLHDLINQFRRKPILA